MGFMDMSNAMFGFGVVIVIAFVAIIVVYILLSLWEKKTGRKIGAKKKK
jgi:hypothetical protein